MLVRENTSWAFPASATGTWNAQQVGRQDWTVDMSTPTLSRKTSQHDEYQRVAGLAVLLDPEGAVLFAPAESTTAGEVAVAVRFSSGLLHAAMYSDDLDRLRIPDQPIFGSERSGLEFTVAVDAVGVGTGISAIDRSLTLRTLAHPDTTPDDLRRPGHVLPVRCRRITQNPPTVYERALAAVAATGSAPVALVCRLVGDRGSELDDSDARLFADRHGFTVHSSVHRPGKSRR